MRESSADEMQPNAIVCGVSRWEASFRNKIMVGGASIHFAIVMGTIASR
jgi:hypothetical protein